MGPALGSPVVVGPAGGNPSSGLRSSNYQSWAKDARRTKISAAAKFLVKRAHLRKLRALREVADEFGLDDGCIWLIASCAGLESIERFSSGQRATIQRRMESLRAIWTEHFEPDRNAEPDGATDTSP